MFVITNLKKIFQATRITDIIATIWQQLNRFVCKCDSWFWRVTFRWGDLSPRANFSSRLGVQPACREGNHLDDCTHFDLVARRAFKRLFREEFDDLDDTFLRYTGRPYHWRALTNDLALMVVQRWDNDQHVRLVRAVVTCQRAFRSASQKRADRAKSSSRAPRRRYVGLDKLRARVNHRSLVDSSTKQSDWLHRFQTDDYTVVKGYDHQSHVTLTRARTAFPQLGEVDTCDCWLTQSHQVVQDPFHRKCLKLLFLEVTSFGTWAPLYNMGSQPSWLLPGRPVGDRYIVTHGVDSRNRIVVTLHSATFCHLQSDASFEKGHQVKILTQLTFEKHVVVGAFSRDTGSHPNVRQYDLSEDVGKVSDHDHTIQNSSDSTLAPRTQSLTHSELAHEIVDTYLWHFTVRKEHHLRNFGGRYIGTDWHDAVDNGLELMKSAPTGSEDTRTVRLGHEEMPQFMKRRIKKAQTILDKAALKYGSKIKNDKTFDASTYQEWQELDLRQYEYSHSLSRTDIVKSMSQSAQSWMKTAFAKHWVNTIIRGSIQNPPSQDERWEKFNDYLVKKIGGVQLPFPSHLLAIEAAKQERARNLRDRQIEARDKELLQRVPTHWRNGPLLAS